MKWLRVRNWERFQHYGGRNPPWIKVYVDLLTNYEFTRLPESSRAHLIGIWLLASRADGQVPNDAEWLGSRISAATPVDLDTLIDAGFLEPVSSKEVKTSLAPDASISREETEAEKKRTSAARARVPAEYRPDFDGQLRASHRPEALIRELTQILDGDQPACKGATGVDVGMALRDASMAGKPLSGGILRGFVRGAMTARLAPSNGMKLPKPVDDYAAASAKLRAEGR